MVIIGVQVIVSEVVFIYQFGADSQLYHQLVAVQTPCLVFHFGMGRLQMRTSHAILRTLVELLDMTVSDKFYTRREPWATVDVTPH